MIDHIFARKEILCRFVLKDASACLLNRKFCEGAMLIKGGDGTVSFACPSALGNKKENAEYFASLLNRTASDFRVIYTRSEKGRQELLKCRRMSITSGTKPVKNKRVLL